ncbi:MAG: transglutaminase domain-containing protein [bacterium]|nr:transglutaminase domain-containing protein [bacterium]
MSYTLPPRWADRFSRRSFLRLAGGGAAGLALGGLGASGGRPALAGPLPISQLSRMVFDVSYRTRVMDLPSDAEEVHVWMPLPPSDYAQKISDFSLTCPLPFEITRDEIYGNRMAHIVSEPRPFEVEARYRVTRERVGAEQLVLAPESAEKYLTLTPRVRVTSEVESFAHTTIGESREPREIGQRAFDAIVDLLSYDKTIPGCGTGDTAWVMRHKRGKCDDYHALFMAVMISRDVPVRWEQGFPLAAPSGDQEQAGSLAGDCTGAHCWASFYAPPQGWIPVDISEADKAEAGGDFFFGQLSPNRFKVSEGRQVTLNPAQGGDPLNTFAFAYAEADGIPLIYGANYENEIKYWIREVEQG